MKKTLAIILTLLLLSCSAGLAASFSYIGDVEQGFNFDQTGTPLIGHLNSLKIGSIELANDFEVSNPVDYSGDNIKIAGIMSSISWDGGFADPIQFSSQVSVANKNSLKILTDMGLSDLSVKFQFTFYGYDQDEKKYYKAFHSNGEVLSGFIQRLGRDLNMYIDSDQSVEVMSPPNFTFNLSVMPSDFMQDIHLAVAVDSKSVKRWGVGIDSVPIPSTLSLLAFGILGLAGVSRRKQ